MLMLISARVFVFLVFAVLGASFLAATVSLWWEFGDAWLDFAALDSHLFVFFPTLGLVALVAFYIPSVLFTDLYWRHIRWEAPVPGGLRRPPFHCGWRLLDNHGARYGKAPEAVLRMQEPQCAARGEPRRLPMPMAVHNLRQVSHNRLFRWPDPPLRRPERRPGRTRPHPGEAPLLPGVHAAFGSTRAPDRRRMLQGAEPAASGGARKLR
jgi:hypothetical protein